MTSGAGWKSLRRGLVVAIVIALCAGAAGAVVSNGSGEIGPASMIQPTGRQLHPTGKLVTLGNFPGGGALTPDGRYLWTLSTGNGINDIRIVKLGVSHGRGTGRVVQTILMPGLDGGIAIAPNGKTVYVSGIAESPDKDLAVPASIPGRGGDVIDVFRVNPRTGHATRNGVIHVPPPSGAPAEQAFPPTTNKESWPQDLAVSPNGKTLLAALNLADMAAVINTRTRHVRYVPVGHYPYGAAITTNGRYGLVGSETQATVSVVKLASAKVTKTIAVGPHLADSEGITVDPAAPLAFVANANEDAIAVLNTKRMRVQGMLSLIRTQGNGTTPTAVSVTGDGCDLLSSDSGEDAIAVFALSRARACNPGGRGRRSVKQFGLVGRIPVASYPVFAGARSVRSPMAWIAAFGIGFGPNVNGPNPTSPFDNDDQIMHFQYLPDVIRGDAGVLQFPSDAQIRRLSPVASAELVPTDSQSPPANTPIRANGPIKHVFFIIKENRTYDQVFGDISRGDGDPKLTLFGANVTPNMHALATRFPLLDHVYSDALASVEGHYWTDSGTVPPYVLRNWAPSTLYANRGRPLDFGLTEAAQAAEGSVFDQAASAGVSFYNYGEVIGAGLAAPLADKDRTPAEEDQEKAVLEGSDVALFGGGPAYPGGPSLAACYSDAAFSIFSPFDEPNVENYDSSLPAGAPADSHSRYDCWLTRFQQQLAHSAVPAINYMVLPLDHTQGVAPGDRTPDADVADNDWALGQIVDTISHSSIWDSSLILVVEDDAQDGADHVDAHRIPALVISPYATKGAVIHNRYDELSFLRTLEIVAGLKPANLGEAEAVPLYDAFSSTPSNSAPYSAIVPNVNMTATNPNNAADRAASAGLNFNIGDQVPEQQFDAILWHYVHGWKSKAPPPGPNASPYVPFDPDEVALPGQFERSMASWLGPRR
jgi:DNA-binding beta-propeller fold protein YncE